MIKKEFFKSKEFKFLLPFIIILSIVTILRGGYAFGQWLYAVLH